MNCATCGTLNGDDSRFCKQCGTPLTLTCGACGRAADADATFCAGCGEALAAQVRYRAGQEGQAPAAGAPVAERRLVSVLFADLVGFTKASEGRDAEDTRELLSRYFDTCRRLIELYGGTVEKFIGDAVMAVWGTPVATEDDAERAVRAALDLVAAVTALGDEVGAPELRARTGVLTGEAAVTIGAEGQGMVAGDLVNTASRIQSTSKPGEVFVGESTRRATDQAIVYASAGSHELKGKSEPVELWRAVRVISGRKGAQRSVGLEAPFVGRDRELRLVKELFHASAEERRAHLVSVIGIGGIGKSRLVWEFYKYFDGLAENVYWHRGRCLAYGDGVTYWALADMVRMRALIAEDEEPASALSKLRATLSEHILDGEERAFVEPRLAQLLGLAEHATGDQQDMFAAWRLFFERLADTYPTVLVFEDLQWADTSLLDFVEYLLEWSRNSPLYVVTLARPEFSQRREGWGSGHRNFTSLYLEPLGARAMTELLDGLVPGLPTELRDKILARAEGVPLYAVETVRMLLDRGLLAQDGDVYRVTGEIAALEVPETLHGLIASRLDGLPPEERRLLQDAAVVGKTFTREAAAAVAGTPEADLDPLLSSLVRKEILSVQADPRSPEHGQYGFLQDLVRHVAYETLSKRERRARHLAAAAHLESVFADLDEIAEVLASHYLDAYTALPDADDAPGVKAKASAALVRAGDRADALGAPGEALRYLEQAAELSDAPLERAALLDRAGWLGVNDAQLAVAERLLGASIALYQANGDIRSAARVSGRLSSVEYWQGKSDAATARAEAAFSTMKKYEPGEELASLAAALASAYYFGGEHAKALEKAELALGLAQQLGSAEVLTRAFAAKALVSHGHRPEEALALRKHELGLAREHDLPELEMNALFNLSDLSFARDDFEDALDYLTDALSVVRRRGSRPGEWSVLAETTYPLFMLGRWDEALAAFAEVPEERLTETTTESFLNTLPEIHLARGDVEGAKHVLALFATHESAENYQQRSMYLAAVAAIARAEGRIDEALLVGVEAAELSRAGEGEATQAVKQGLVEAIEAALALGERERARELLATIDAVKPGLRSPYLGAHTSRFRARLAELADDAESGFAAAAKRFRELAIPFWLGVTLLEQAEHLTAEGRTDDAGPLLDEAREIFDRLGATPWLERLDAARVKVRA